MAIQTTEALVTRTVDFSETSQILAFLTRDFGQIKVIAKGARRKSQIFDGPIDLFQHRRIWYYPSSRERLHVLAESEFVERFEGLRSDLARTYAAFYLVDLAAEASPADQPALALFDLTIGTLRGLSEGRAVPRLIARFEARFLKIHGAWPQLDACVTCRATLPKSGTLRFSFREGGVVCPRCAGEATETAPIARGTLARLETLAAEDSALADRLRLTDREIREIAGLLRRHITHVLEHPPRFLRLAP